MSKRDQISSIVLIIIGIIVCFGSMRLGLGTIRLPGLGFFPFISGVFLGLSSLLVLIGATLKKKSKVASTQETISLWKGIKVIAAFFIYTLLLSKIGYVMGSFLLMLFLLKGVETVKWRGAVVTAVLTVLASYFIFDVCLHCMLPTGFVDFRDLVRWIF